MGIAGNFPLTVGELGLDLVGTGYPQLGHADVELHEGEQRVGAACLYMEPVRGSSSSNMEPVGGSVKGGGQCYRVAPGEL